jgi:hypothetical protein
MARVLIVGINPSTAANSKTISRLCTWAEQLGIDYYSFVNCISQPGLYSFNDIDYNFLAECSKGYEKVIALGNFPSKALKKINIKHFTLPHPSGLNRKLNDPMYVKDQLEKCRDYINGS